MNKVRRNSIIVLLLTIVLLFFLLRKNFTTTIRCIAAANFWLIILVIVLFVISYIFDSLSYYYVIKQYKSDYKLQKAFRLNILTRFFNGITPLASGGQPFQLYELHKDEVKMHDASTIVIQFYIIYQIALVLISTVSVILLITMHLMALDTLIKHMLIFGYIVNLAILFILFFISFNKTANKKVINFFIKILYKMHIVKNKEQLIDKWSKSCDEFYVSAQMMIKNKATFIRGIILQVFQLIFLYAIPLVIVYAINVNSSLNVLNTIMASSFVFLAGCYVPIPGASGGMEYGFYKFFGSFIPKNSIQAVIILWRFVTYFLPVLIGGIIFNIRTKEDN